MGYDSTTGILTAPFTKIGSNGDLQQALDRAVTSHIQLIGDVNSNGDDLNPGKINKWAFYKPVKSSQLRPLSDTERKEVKCGLLVTMYQNPGDLKTNFESQWAYDKPVAGTNPLRASDFVQSDPTTHAILVSGTRGGYNKNAASPFYGWYNKPEGRYVIGQGGREANIGLNALAQLPAYSVKVSDLIDGAGGHEFKDMYIGLLIFTGSTYAGSTLVGLKTHASTIGQLEAQGIQNVIITLTDSDIPAAENTQTKYYIFPVISFTAAATLTAPVNNRYDGLYACPPDVLPYAVLTSVPSTQNITVSILALSATPASGGYRVTFTGRVDVGSAAMSGTVYYDIYNNDTGTGTPVASGSFASSLSPGSQFEDEIVETIRQSSSSDYITVVMTYQSAVMAQDTTTIE
jgi:hypothetical protein